MACSNLDCYWGMHTNVCVRLDCRTPPPPRPYHSRRPLFPYLKGPGAARGRDCYVELNITAGTIVARRGSHPLERGAFARRTTRTTLDPVPTVRLEHSRMVRGFACSGYFPDSSGHLRPRVRDESRNVATPFEPFLYLIPELVHHLRSTVTPDRGAIPISLHAESLSLRHRDDLCCRSCALRRTRATLPLRVAGISCCDRLRSRIRL